MAWKVRKPGTEVLVPFRDEEGEVLLTAVYKTPTIAEAQEIAEGIDGEDDGGAWYPQRFALGRLLVRVEGVENEDGSAFEIGYETPSVLSVDTAEALLPFIGALFNRAVGFVNYKGIEEAKN